MYSIRWCAGCGVFQNDFWDELSHFGVQLCKDVGAFWIASVKILNLILSKFLLDQSNMGWGLVLHLDPTISRNILLHDYWDTQMTHLMNAQLLLVLAWAVSNRESLNSSDGYSLIILLAISDWCSVTFHFLQGPILHFPHSKRSQHWVDWDKVQLWWEDDLAFHQWWHHSPDRCFPGNTTACVQGMHKWWKYSSWKFVFLFSNQFYDPL